MNNNSKEVPAEFLCPITMMPMVDPVIMPDGYTYEREAIRKALEISHQSPMTRQPMTIDNAIPNRALQHLIQDSFKKPGNKFENPYTSSDYQQNLPTKEQLRARIQDLETASRPNNSCMLNIKLNDFQVVGHETVNGYLRIYTYWELYKEKQKIASHQEMTLEDKDDYSILLCAAYSDFMGEGPRILSFCNRISLKDFSIGRSYQNTAYLAKCGPCRDYDSHGLVVNYELELKPFTK